MKTKKELSALKEEVETVSKKLRELTDEELAQVTGGCDVRISLLHEDTVSVEPGFIYADEGQWVSLNTSGMRPSDSPPDL